MNNVLHDLQEWFYHNCNGDWEHGYCIKIQTLDNPGWMVDINLEDTGLDSNSFTDIYQEYNENNWIHCKVANNTFLGRGGPRNLVDIIKIFIEWANSQN